MAGGDDREVARLQAQLTDPARRVTPAGFPRDGDQTDQPGLYAWFVDDEGAAALGRGLGKPVAPMVVVESQVYFVTDKMGLVSAGAKERP